MSWWNPLDIVETAGDVWGEISGSKNAADAQRQAGQLGYDAAIRGQDMQRQMWEQGRADMAPFRGLGLSALNDYYGRVQRGGDDADLKRIQAEQTANFNTQMAGRGLLGSSGSIKGLSDLGAKIAEAREQRYYERMQPLLGVGGSMAGQGANNAMQFGQNQAQLGMQGANALGAGIAGGAQADAAGRMGLLNTGMMGLGLYAAYGGGAGKALGATAGPSPGWFGSAF